MTVVEHLEELRYRMVVSALTFFVASIIAFLLFDQILDVLTLPLDEGGKIADIQVEGLSVQGITSGFLVHIKVAVFGGLVFALPVILYQVWRFITPGLEAKEKRYAIPFVLSSLFLFFVGAFVAYLVLPQALGFLLGFTKGFQPIIFVDQYVGFVTFMVIAFAITFELPMLLVFLAMVGVVSSAWLRGHRRHAAVLTFVIAAVATPSQDPYTLTMMAVPLYLLYEVALLVIRYGMKK